MRSLHALDIKDIIRNYVLFSAELDRAWHGERDDHIAIVLKSSRPYAQKYSLLKIYLACSYDLNKLRGPYGIPLVTEMVLENNFEALELLIAFNVDVNKESSAGETPLHVACRLGNARILGLLVSAGADIHKPTRKGVKALDIAIEAGYLEIQSVLKQGGRKSVWGMLKPVGIKFRTFLIIYLLKRQGYQYCPWGLSEKSFLSEFSRKKTVTLHCLNSLHRHGVHQ